MEIIKPNTDIIAPHQLFGRNPKGRRGIGSRCFWGKGQILNADGTVAWEEDWQRNFLADEGEQNILNDWLLEQSALTKYLALLTATPAETATMATMTEVYAPPLNGYARQQISAGDWAAPTLNANDYQTTAAAKTFGPSTSNAWAALTYVALVSTATGTAGKFLLAIALSGTTTVNIGQSFIYQLTVKAQ